MTVEDETFKILQENKSFGMTFDELANKVYESVHRKSPDKECGSVRNEVAVALDKGLKTGKIKKPTTGFYCWNR